MIAVGARVRLVRTVGAAGSQLKERVGQVGVVETVRTTGQKTEVEVAFGPHWATGSGAWWCKPEELELIEETAQDAAEGVGEAEGAQPVGRGLARPLASAEARKTTAGEGSP